MFRNYHFSTIDTHELTPEIVAGMHDRTTTSCDGSMTTHIRVVLRQYPLTNYPDWAGNHSGNWSPRWDCHTDHPCRTD